MPANRKLEPMRSSVPIPCRTLDTSAPTASHRPAMVFMKEMRVASIALAAYLVISAEAMSMNRIGLPVRTKGSYSSARRSRAYSDSTPTTTRSGFMKSWTAAPSLRNSGLEQTWNGRVVWRRIASRTLPAVPTGTVLLVMTIFSGPSAGMLRPTVSATASTCCRSAEPSSPGGVPTAMKMTSAPRTASATSVVKRMRPSERLRSTSGSRPGS